MEALAPQEAASDEAAENELTDDRKAIFAAVAEFERQELAQLQAMGAMIRPMVKRLSLEHLTAVFSGQVKAGRAELRRLRRLLRDILDGLEPWLAAHQDLPKRVQRLQVAAAVSAVTPATQSMLRERNQPPIKRAIAKKVELLTPR
jgi:hypothetical protein